jgi:hypothetical protein
MALRDILRGAGIGAAIAQGDQNTAQAIRTQISQEQAVEKLDRRKQELSDNDILFETPQAAALKIKELEGQGIKAKTKFDPKLQAFVIDSTEPGTARKPARSLLPTLEDVKQAAGGNLFEAEFLEDPETGETGFAFKIKKSEGATTENTKELNSRLNKLSDLGGDVSREELNAFSTMAEKLDFVNNKISATVSSKKTASEEKREVEKLDLKTGTDDLIDLFTKAQEEAKSASPSVGQAGVTGRISGGLVARQAQALGQTVGGVPLPNVSAYNASMKAFATVAAKAAGEVRPTDQDIIRFMGTLPRVTLSDKENQILIDQLKRKTKDTEALADSWLQATGKKVTQLQTEETFQQKDTVTDIRPTGTIKETTEGKFEHVGFDKATGKKKYRRLD